MEPVTAARCPGCGYENNPYYRYCGMCGSPLREGEPALPPIPAPRPAESLLHLSGPAPRLRETLPKKPSITIGGLSILGLAEASSEEGELVEESGSSDYHLSGAQESPLFSYGSESNRASSRDVHYLLEDDEARPRVHWRMYAALVLLAVTSAALIWHWQSNGYPWEAGIRGDFARRTSAALNKSDPATSGDASANLKPSPSSVPPTGPASSESANPMPSPGGIPSAPAASESAASRPATSSPSDTDVPAVQAAGRASVEPIPAEPTAAASEPVESIPAQSSPAARAQTPRPVVPSTENPGPTGPAQLYAAGEKYLYGNGVPQDCDRAQKDLRTSAAHSYPQAEGLLATMYASGHCLGRDLPAAYRWYARALHHEPANSRIAADLQVLWSQMTPAERKAAQTSGQ